MPYTTDKIPTSALVAGSFAANIERVARESFSILATIHGIDRQGQYSDGTQWTVLRVTNKAGHPYQITVFSDQAPEIWGLTNKVGQRDVGLVVHPYNTSNNFRGTHKVCQVAEDWNKVKRAPRAPGLALLSGAITPIAAMLDPGAEATAFLAAGSQNWKEYKNDLHRYVPL